MCKITQKCVKQERDKEQRKSLQPRASSKIDESLSRQTKNKKDTDK